MKATISKIRKFATANPAFVTFGLSLAITLAIGAAIGMLDHQQAFAFRCEMRHGECV
jgi:hypothetical protein